MPYTKKGPYGPIIYLSDKPCVIKVTRFIIMMGFHLSKQISTTHTVYNTLNFATNNKAPIKGPYYYIHNRKSVNLSYWLTSGSPIDKTTLILRKLVVGHFNSGSSLAMPIES
ncbi:hypothetical protein DL796_05150 [Kangiella spongicola]|uniref:Uncharacterized protein n=1 Tax=Kangiella spongicola TaxID=796379 RepID=A0A318DC65_9GAMM|nr:hypothetical protein DL796_05150 [Kangiella spongicola]